MKPTFRSLTLTNLLLLSTAVTFAQGTDSRDADGTSATAPARERFLARAAATLGTPEGRLTLDRIEGPLTLGELGRDVFVASVLDDNGRKSVVALDASGAPVDLDRAHAEASALQVSRLGKLSPRLADRFVADGAHVPQLAVLWITAPSVDDLRHEHAELVSELDRTGAVDAAMMDRMRTEHFAAIQRRIEPATLAAEARLRAAGFEVLGHDELAPVVFVRGAEADLQRMASDASVESIDWAGMQYAERLNIANAEVRAGLAWTASGSTTGLGARVAVVEGGTVCSTNPLLAVAATRIAGQPASVHTTGVASCIASRDSRGFGVAPNATILSANGADFFAGSTSVSAQMPGSVAAITWALNNNADILNLSYGAGTPTATISAFDRYLDYVARNLATTIVIACGNSGGFAGDPGAGYNQIAVGAFDDRGVSTWGNEVMGGFSSFMNPSSGLETPQVVAPGVLIGMQTCAVGGFGYLSSGTSFSSPLVAGEAALIVSRQPALKSWPEAVRAIVMATAWHNIEGATALSSRDGAGGIDARAAVVVAGRGRGPGYQFGTLTAASFDAGGNLAAQTTTATVGQRVRVCLSFDSVVTGAAYESDRLHSDLDLYVYGPSGQLVAASTSSLNSFEVVDFMAPVSGTYTVQVRRFRLGATAEYYGTAVSLSSDI